MTLIGNVCTNFLYLFSEEQKESPTELAFKYAVFKINKAKDVLPNNSLTYDIQYVPSEDSFRTTKKVNIHVISRVFLPRQLWIVNYYIKILSKVRQMIPLNIWSWRKRGSASNPKMEYQVLSCIFH